MDQAPVRKAVSSVPVPPTLPSLSTWSLLASLTCVLFGCLLYWLSASHSGKQEQKVEHVPDASPGPPQRDIQEQPVSQAAQQPSPGASPDVPEPVPDREPLEDDEWHEQEVVGDEAPVEGVPMTVESVAGLSAVLSRVEQQQYLAVLLSNGIFDPAQLLPVAKPAGPTSLAQEKIARRHSGAQGMALLRGIDIPHTAAEDILLSALAYVTREQHKGERRGSVSSSRSRSGRKGSRSSKSRSTAINSLSRHSTSTMSPSVSLSSASSARRAGLAGGNTHRSGPNPESASHNGPSHDISPRRISCDSSMDGDSSGWFAETGRGDWPRPSVAKGNSLPAAEAERAAAPGHYSHTRWHEPVLPNLEGVPQGQRLGLLAKKSARIGHWQRRYFSIDWAYLRYWRSKRQSKLLGSLDLRQMLRVFIRDNGQVELVLPDRQMVLKAATIEEARRWVRQLRIQQRVLWCELVLNAPAVTSADLLTHLLGRFRGLGLQPVLVPDKLGGRAAALGKASKLRDTHKRTAVASKQLTKRAVEHFFTNRFKEAWALCQRHGADNTSLLCFRSFIAMIRSLGSMEAKAFNWALKLTWEAEAAGRALATSDDVAQKLEGQLVQATSCLLGSLIQFLCGSFVKAAWNVRTSWVAFDSIYNEVIAFQGPERSSLLGWAFYGKGFFTLLLSMLPRTSSRIMSLLGFTGDRALGLRWLRKAAASPCWIAIIACITLLSYYLSYGAFFGDEIRIEDAQRLLLWARFAYPGSVYVDWFQCSMFRIQGRLQEAIQVASGALLKCKDFPAIAVLFHYQKGWCAFIGLDWARARTYFKRLLAYARQGDVDKEQKQLLKQESTQDRAPNDQLSWRKGGLCASVPGRNLPEAWTELMLCTSVYKGVHAYQIAVAAAMEDDWESAWRWFGRVSPLLAENANHRQLDLWSQSKADWWLLRRKASRPYAVLDALEIIHRWNAFGHVSVAIQREIRQLLRQVSPQGRHMEELGVVGACRYWLFKASHARCLHDLAKAHKALGEIFAHEHLLRGLKSDNANFTLARAYFELACVHTWHAPFRDVEQALAALAKAKSIRGYRLYRVLGLRIHSLAQVLARAER